MRREFEKKGVKLWGFSLGFSRGFPRFFYGVGGLE